MRTGDDALGESSDRESPPGGNRLFDEERFRGLLLPAEFHGSANIAGEHQLLTSIDVKFERRLHNIRLEEVSSSLAQRNRISLSTKRADGPAHTFGDKASPCRLIPLLSPVHEAPAARGNRPGRRVRENNTHSLAPFTGRERDSHELPPCSRIPAVNSGSNTAARKVP